MAQFGLESWYGSDSLWYFGHADSLWLWTGYQGGIMQKGGQASWLGRFQNYAAIDWRNPFLSGQNKQTEILTILC